jgi:hypothetical protein
VEVYFPQTNSWVTFDPTPPAGRVAKTRSGLAGMLSKYSEALELMWFQYVVGYDKEEQRSLVSSVRRQLSDLQSGSMTKFDRLRTALPSLIRALLITSGSMVGLLAVIFLTRRVSRFGWRRGLKVWQAGTESDGARVDFYDRLLKALEKQGIKRELYQTPLEFASVAGINGTQAITNAYNRVRFGDEKLSASERSQIESLLSRLERKQKKN